MLRRTQLICCLMIGSCIGCVPMQPKMQLSPLEVREMQTRSYRTSNTKLVMRAVLNVLQDEGYIASNAVPDLGLITATHDLDIEDPHAAAIHQILSDPGARWEKREVTEANAQVSQFGRETRVRLSLQKKVYDNLGNVMRVKMIEDAQLYQRLLSAIDHGVFIELQGL